MKKVLVLGAGLVSRPLVRYLLDNGFGVTVASRTVSKAEKLIQNHARGKALAFNVDDTAGLSPLVAGHDLAVSLLPAARHVEVARACLEHRKHMVTTSYISPAMRELDAEAKRRDVLLLNELGVDPGIDHMSAMQVIDAEQKKGSRLAGFVSWCGGLPAPEANDNPFGYKFSWSPKGVLLAARNGARYRRAGKLLEIPPPELFARPAQVEVPGVGTFEGYPNRDSLSYIETYGFDPNIEEMFRGTLRNQGHCELYRGLIALGLLEDSPRQSFADTSYLQLVEKLAGKPAPKAITKRLGAAVGKKVIEALDFIGLLSQEPVRPAEGSVMDVMAERMAERLAYRPGERDMLIMKHEITFRRNDGKRERLTALMVDFGIPAGDSSMSRTVSLPAAIGARLVLEGKIPLRGVHAPVKPEIYLPALDELKQMGIGFTETRSVL